MYSSAAPSGEAGEAGRLAAVADVAESEAATRTLSSNAPESSGQPAAPKPGLPVSMMVSNYAGRYMGEAATSSVLLLRETTAANSPHSAGKPGTKRRRVEVAGGGSDSAMFSQSLERARLQAVVDERRMLKQLNDTLMAELRKVGSTLVSQVEENAAIKRQLLAKGTVVGEELDAFLREAVDSNAPKPLSDKEAEIVAAAALASGGCRPQEAMKKLLHMAMHP